MFSLGGSVAGDMDVRYDPSQAVLLELNGWDFDGGELRCRYSLDGTSFEERFVFPRPLAGGG